MMIPVKEAVLLPDVVVLVFFLLLVRRSEAESIFLQGTLGTVESLQDGGGLKSALLDVLSLYAGATGKEDVRLVVSPARIGNRNNGDDKKEGFRFRPTNHSNSNSNGNGNNQDLEVGNYHFRFVQHLEGMPIQGAALVMHVTNDDNKTVFAVNGEFVPSNSDSIVNRVNLNCSRAMDVALKQSGFKIDNNTTKWESECLPAAVLGRKGDKTYIGYERRLLYNGFQYADLFAWLQQKQ